MTANKTQATNDSVENFIATLEPKQQEDCRTLVRMLGEISGEPAVLWGKIIGFGSYRYKYASGREGDWMKIGFSPRKTQFSLYFSVLPETFDHDAEALGTYSTGKGCLYIKRLSDIDVEVLKTICAKAYAAAGKDVV